MTPDAAPSRTPGSRRSRGSTGYGNDSRRIQRRGLQCERLDRLAEIAAYVEPVHARSDDLSGRRPVRFSTYGSFPAQRRVPFLSDAHARMVGIAADRPSSCQCIAGTRIPRQGSLMTWAAPIVVVVAPGCSSCLLVTAYRAADESQDASAAWLRHRPRARQVVEPGLFGLNKPLRTARERTVPGFPVAQTSLDVPQRSVVRCRVGSGAAIPLGRTHPRPSRQRLRF
jgi:hypothetical protein